MSLPNFTCNHADCSLVKGFPSHFDCLSFVLDHVDYFLSRVQLRAVRRNCESLEMKFLECILSESCSVLCSIIKENQSFLFTFYFLPCMMSKVIIDEEDKGLSCKRILLHMQAFNLILTQCNAAVQSWLSWINIDVEFLPFDTP